MLHRYQKNVQPQAMNENARTSNLGVIGDPLGFIVGSTIFPRTFRGSYAGQVM
jgi:hypothetical protein